MDCEKIYEQIKEKTYKDAHNNVGFFHALIREMKPCFNDAESLVNNIILCEILIQHIKTCQVDFMKEMTTAELIYILECFTKNKISYINVEPRENDEK